MKIETMIYVYITICISMILYNVAYVFILKRRVKKLAANSAKLENIILKQIDIIENGGEISGKHINFLKRRLDTTAGITAFDKALENISEKREKGVERYLTETFSVYEYLTHRYISKDTLKIAYFPYILHKYNILKKGDSDKLLDIFYELLRSVNVYCRENTLKAIYSIQSPEATIKALKIIDKNLTFHHPKLITDGLMFFKGDREIFKNLFFDSYREFSINMRVNILNYIRFSGIRCDEEMLRILKNEEENRELHFSAIRYFEKFPSEEARQIIYDFAENIAGRTWEYQAIATSALKSYKSDVTFRILVKNLSSSNWHVRQNSAISCEKLGYTYRDLINVFDGEDRYAREIMRYRLDRREAEEEAVKA